MSAMADDVTFIFANMSFNRCRAEVLQICIGVTAASVERHDTYYFNVSHPPEDLFSN